MPRRKPPSTNPDPSNRVQALAQIKTRILKQIAWAGADDAVTHEVIEHALNDAWAAGYSARGADGI